MSNSQELQAFYELLGEGVSVGTLLLRYEEIIELVHRAELTADFRLGKGALKKLRDEVVPVVRYVRAMAAPPDVVRIAFDSSYPDCILSRAERRREIEVTVAQAMERLHTMSELNATGRSRAYLGLSDAQPQTAFAEAMQRDQIAYTTREVISCVSDALAICVQKKSKYEGDILLIEVPNLQILPHERWVEHASEFREVTQAVRFDEVYLTGRSSLGDVCLCVG